jgi:hypothetical protein
MQGANLDVAIFRNLFSFLLLRLAKNPIFEAISLHGLTGVLKNKGFLASSTQLMMNLF